MSLAKLLAALTSAVFLLGALPCLASQIGRWSTVARVTGEGSVNALIEGEGGDVWLVGGASRSLMYRVRGGTVESEPVPDVGVLRDIAWKSPNRGWAIGERGILEFDGVFWEEVAGLDSTSGVGPLWFGNSGPLISAVNEQDIWFATPFRFLDGNYVNSPRPYSDIDGIQMRDADSGIASLGGFFSGGKLARYDGTGWSEFYSADSGIVSWAWDSQGRIWFIERKRSSSLATSDTDYRLHLFEGGEDKVLFSLRYDWLWKDSYMTNVWVDHDDNVWLNYVLKDRHKLGFILEGTTPRSVKETLTIQTPVSIRYMKFTSKTSGWAIGSDNSLMRGEVVTPSLSATPSVITFPKTQQSTPVRSTLTISNIGAGLLRVERISSDTQVFRARPDSALLGPGEAVGIVVAFVPDWGGEHRGKLTITSNDPQNPTKTITLVGEAEGPLPSPNNAPGFSAIADREVEIDQAVRIALSATDADGDALTYSVAGNPGGSSLSGNTFTWTPTVHQVGTHTLNFIVSDGRGGSDTETVLVSVPTPSNQAPVLAAIADREVEIDQAVRIALSATDADGDALTYSVAGNPGGSSLSGSTFAWTPSTAQVGVHTLTFTVADGRGGADTGAVTLTVQAKPVPVISVLPTSVNFGAVVVGESKTLNLVVSNDGASPLRVVNIVSSSASVRVSGSGLTIEPGANKTLLITLDPSTVGVLRATLDIPSNDPDTPLLQVSLSGTVERTPDQPSLVLDVGLAEFGQVAVGETAAFVVPIRNEGSAPLDVSNVVSDDRQVVGSPSSLKIPPQESGDLTLLFRPLPEEAREGKVTLFTNEPDQSRIEIVWSALDVATPFLSVTSVKPTAAASGVASDTQIGVTFSAPLFERRGFVGVDAQMLPEPLSGPLSGTAELRGDGRIATFPVELASDQIYRLVVFGATARDGLRLFEAFETTFSTGAGEPILASVSGSVVVNEGAHPIGSVFLFDSISNRLVAQAAISLDGTFSLDQVPVGSYEVFAEGTVDDDPVGGSYDIDGDGLEDPVIVDSGEAVEDLEIVMIARERGGSVGSEAAITLDLDTQAGDQGVTRLQGVGPDEEIVVEVYSAAVEALTGFAVSVGVDTSQVFFQSAEAGANLLDQSEGTVLYLSHFDPQQSAIEFGGSVMGPTPETAVSGEGLLGRWHFRTAPDFEGDVSIQIEKVTLRTLESRVDWTPDVSGVVSSVPELERPSGPISIDFSPSPGDQGQVVAGSAVTGAQYMLQLHIADAPEIKGWSATLAYDPAQLAYETGSFEASDFLPGLFGLTNEKEGNLEVGGTVLGAEATHSGDGFLGTLAFEILEGFTGDAEIVITIVSLNTVEAGEEILSVHFVARITSEAVQPILVGDFSGDGIVNFSDFFLFADAFGGSDPLYDLTGDGTVNFSDFFVFADQFGSEARAKLLVLAQEHLGLPPTTTLGVNYPNPFNAETVIPFRLATAAEVKLAVFNLTGQRVRTLVSGIRQAGRHEAVWDGSDDLGNRLGTGVYFCRLQTDVEIRTQKLLLAQ